MLHVRMLSGGDMGIPLEELGIDDVKGLKRHLSHLHGFPRGFRQRLVYDGRVLEDVAKLDCSMDLDLVLLNFAEVSQEQVDDFVKAAYHCSMAEVESKLRLPQDPDLSRKEGVTALMAASYGGRVEVVSLLLEAGADPNLGMDTGTQAYPLSQACHGRHVEVVRLLLDAGADANVVGDGVGTTALMTASDIGHAEVVHLLLDAGADTNLADIAGRTAVMRASAKGHVEVVRLLLEAGADAHVADRGGCTALMLASENGHVEAVRLLLDAGTDVNVADFPGQTALISACQKSHVEVVRLLLEANADTNMAHGCGETALMSASGRGPVEAVRLLLKARADTKMMARGDTAFMRAMYGTYRGHAEVSRLLLEAGRRRRKADVTGVMPK